MRIGHLERSGFLGVMKEGFWLQSCRGEVKNDLGNRPAFDRLYHESFCSFPTSSAQILHEAWDA